MANGINAVGHTLWQLPADATDAECIHCDAPIEGEDFQCAPCAGNTECQICGKDLHLSETDAGWECANCAAIEAGEE